MTRKPPNTIQVNERWIEDAYGEVIIGSKAYRRFWVTVNGHDVLTSRWELERAGWSAEAINEKEPK